MSRLAACALVLAVLAPACGQPAAAPDPVAAPPASGPVAGSSAGASDAAAPPPDADVSDAAVSDAIRAAVDAADRADEDRALDAQRRPAELLAFFLLAPGQRVAELGAGGGYTAELLARVVGPAGHVWGQNSRYILERFAERPWSERLSKPVMAIVTRVDTPFDAPLPADASGLDAVLNVLFYHDTVWMGVDRSAMNAAVFAALRPGGVYGIVDHSARPGDGVSQVETLHRIELAVLVAEVTAAGFVLEAESSLLRNPSDTRDWNASPSKAGELRGTSDRFVLRFRKPDR